MEEERIYNLIPIEPEKELRPPRYRSKYPGDLAPTASTFGASTTSPAGVTNMGGQMFQPRLEKHKRPMATFGPLDGTRKPATTKFLKSHEGEIEAGSPKAGVAEGKFSYSGDRKPAVPTDQPITGLKTTKNFIKANALQAILSQPPALRDTTTIAKHAEYGKVPEYLEAVKREVASEYAYIKQIAGEEEEAANPAPDVKLLPEEEKQALLKQLKDKWELINHEYQTITHLVKLDTIGKRRRKERYEADLAQLEKDIEKLSKKYVLVNVE